MLRYRQIFDIEDEMEETEGDPDRILIAPPHGNGLEHRVSRRSSRPSTRSLRPAHPPSPKEHEPDHSQYAPPRDGGHHRQTTAPISLRRRLTPSIHKHDVSQSPLAQVFQPLIVDEPEDTISDSASAGGGSAFLLQPQLSYGPATRRRLASMQSAHKRPNETLWATKSVRPAFPPLDTRAETLGGSVSVSPDNHEQEERGIATAEQVEEIVEGNGGMSEWMKRIERIEGRQERIEDLLVQLHAQLQKLPGRR
jgi:hypothetical protein